MMQKPILPLFVCLCLALSACTAPAPSTQDQGEREVVVPNPKCIQQLRSGYALNERIDEEYEQTLKAGVFQGHMEELTAKWSNEANEWAAKTMGMLFRIDGPTAMGRFNSAMTSTNPLGNRTRSDTSNYLRVKLNALESICKGTGGDRQ
jgi:hypothetical protein